MPTPELLASHAMRHFAGAALVLLAAALVHHGGYSDQQWQYVAVAAALVPQVLLDILAVKHEDRRARLRTSALPSVVPLLASAALGIAASAQLLSGGVSVAMAAAVCATVGLAVAAAPTAVVIAPRSGPAREARARTEEGESAR